MRAKSHSLCPTTEEGAAPQHSSTITAQPRGPNFTSRLLPLLATCNSSNTNLRLHRPPCLSVSQNESWNKFPSQEEYTQLWSIKRHLLKVRVLALSEHVSICLQPPLCLSAALPSCERCCWLRLRSASKFISFPDRIQSRFWPDYIHTWCWDRSVQLKLHLPFICMGLKLSTVYMHVWHSSISIAPWWLSAVQVINPTTIRVGCIYTLTFMLHFDWHQV